MRTVLNLTSIVFTVFFICLPHSSSEYAAHTQLGLPEGAKARLGKGRICQRKPTYSPDGVHLALASSIGVWLIDVRTGQEVSLLTGHGAVFSVAFSPDGKLLASGNRDGSLQLWDVATREHQATFTGHPDPITSVAFSPDGKTLGSSDGTLQLWDVATGESWDVDTKGKVGKVGRFPTSVVFGPDGKTLITTSSYGGLFKLWTESIGARKATLFWELQDARSVAFSPDGKTLASGSQDGKVQLWDVTTGKHKATFTGHFTGITSVAFSPDGKTLASGSDDFTVRLWDVTTGKHKATLGPQSSSVTHVAFSPDGKTLASASRDGTVRLLEADTGKHKATLTGHPFGPELIAAFSPDGETLTTIGSDGTVRLWDTNPQKLKALIAEGPSDGTVRLWDADPDTNPQKLIELFLKGPDVDDIGVGSVAFSPDGETLAIAKEREVQLWDVAAREPQASFTGHVKCVAFSPDGETLASASRDGTVWLLEADTGKHKAMLTGHSHRPKRIAAFSPDGETLARSAECVAFSPDGETLASSGVIIQLCDADTGQYQADLRGDERLASYGLKSNHHFETVDGNRILLQLWDVAIGKPKATLREYSKELFHIYSVVFSPDGETLAIADGGVVKLWDVATGKRKLIFPEDSGGVLSVAFSPDGKTLASGSNDFTVRLWDVATGEPQATFTGHSGSVKCVAFSPDGETLVSGSKDYTVLLWNLAQGKKPTQKSVDKTREPIISKPDPKGGQPGHQEIKEAPVSDIPLPDIDPSLILHFSFDELKGHLTIDHSQYQNHGTLVGNPQLVAGKFGNALKFNGRSDWVEVPHDDTLNVNDDFTIMAWIHTPRHHGPGFSAWQGIVGKSNNPRSYSFYTKDGGYLHLSVGEHISSDSDGKVALNAWQHVVVQIDKEWQRFWINGENVGNLLINARLPGKVDTAPVRIGNTHDNRPMNAPDRHFLGMIDEIRIYNRALSKAEIIQQMQIGYK